ncbi:MAG: YfiT family bacillithiol transferase, partial [Bacteroidota bacterium]
LILISMSVDLRYPLGTFGHDGPVLPPQRTAWIDDIAALPLAFRNAAESLSGSQLDTPYREGGWTLRQVIHHVPDSHLNAYTRFCWTLTEDTPTIKAYDENAWARLKLYAGPIEPSLALLDAIHARWTALLRGLDEAAWARRFHHPETDTSHRLDMVLGTYAWHGRHHLAHLTTTIDRFGW